MPVLVAVEDQSELVRGPAGLRRRPGVGPVPVPGAAVSDRDEQRGEGGAGQFRVAARDHQCRHVVVVPGDLLCDGPAGWQACRHDRGRGDDLGRAEKAQVPTFPLRNRTRCLSRRPSSCRRATLTSLVNDSQATRRACLSCIRDTRLVRTVHLLPGITLSDGRSGGCGRCAATGGGSLKGGAGGLASRPVERWSRRSPTHGGAPR